MEMIHITLEVAYVLRETLRVDSIQRIMSEDEHDALLHLNAKIAAGPEYCSSWPKPAR